MPAIKINRPYYCEYCKSCKEYYDINMYHVCPNDEFDWGEFPERDKEILK